MKTQLQITTHEISERVGNEEISIVVTLNHKPKTLDIHSNKSSDGKFNFKCGTVKDLGKWRAIADMIKNACDIAEQNFNHQIKTKQC